MTVQDCTKSTRQYKNINKNKHREKKEDSNNLRCISCLCVYWKIQICVFECVYVYLKYKA